MAIEQVDEAVVTQEPAALGQQTVQLIVLWAVDIFRHEPARAR